MEVKSMSAIGITIERTLFGQEAKGAYTSISSAEATQSIWVVK